MFFSLNESKILSTNSINARSLEWWSLNPNCFPYNILFWSKYEYDLLYMIRFNILEKRGSKTGVTFAIFIFSGNDPLSMEFLNTCNKRTFISSYTDLIKFTCNSSKPGLLSFFED